AREAARVLQYGPTEGFPPLREFLASLMEGRGLSVAADQVLTLNGSQQGLDAIAKLLIDPGALVLVEEPTYVGALQAFRPYQPRFIGLPMDDEGLDLSALEQVLRSGEQPRFLYLVSCFQNPTGITLSPERKRALLEVAAKYRLPIVEDDPYGELYYEGTRPPILAAMDAEQYGELRHVVYLSTFSKLLAPGLRVGWVAAPKELFGKLVHVKQGLDLHTGSLSQAVAYEACRDGLLERHVPKIRMSYHARRDAMIASFERFMPRGVTWTRPMGGMFIWLTLPAHVDATTLLQASLEQKVAFVPGGAFYANGGGSNTMRLNFSHSTPERIAEGVSRLARSIAELL
ncbi:MAG TPA: PLP-dependent aminotransferase family protein, partial [Roseiflexaceae bacterium]|nr:PLP-dependent aminotransferase family protein [Roseiflexaceae bacterium]